MNERMVDVPTPDGRMETFVAHPEAGGPFPAVVVYMDIWGVRDELFGIARRIAAAGYYCMVPDLYYRQGRVRNEFRDADDRMISLHRLGAAEESQVREARDRLTSADVMNDTAALIEFIAADAPVRPGPAGAMGFCMGGWLTLHAAGHFPERFRASASLHGTRLISGRDDSPHLLAKKFQGELYCGFGALDPFSPSALIEELDALLRPCAVEYGYRSHAGAEHGYFLPDRDIYDSDAAELDWELILAMFRRQLWG